jgi:DNA-binding PadR family transcriptional regulator
MYVDILILAELISQPCHGYELKRRVERLLGNTLTINANQLYPTLRRFEEMGAVTREVERQVGRPDRHVYNITDRGTEVLQQFLQDFSADLARNDDEFGTRVAFFHLLDIPARRAILTTRKEVLQRRLEYIEQSRSRMNVDAPNYFYVTQLLAFQQQQIQQGLLWITALMQESTELA